MFSQGMPFCKLPEIFLVGYIGGVECERILIFITALLKDEETLF